MSSPVASWCSMDGGRPIRESSRGPGATASDHGPGGPTGALGRSVHQRSLSRLSRESQSHQPSRGPQEQRQSHALPHAATTTVGKYPATLTSGDFDRNGKLDLAVVNFLDNSVSLLFGNGSRWNQSSHHQRRWPRSHRSHRRRSRQRWRYDLAVANKTPAACRSCVTWATAALARPIISV